MTVQKGLIPILAAPMIDPSIGRIDVTMPVGSTVAEIVDGVLPNATAYDRRHLRVMLVSDRGMIAVSIEHWHGIRPKEGVRVVIRLIPGKQVLKSVLQIVVAIAAVAIGAFFAPALAGALGISTGLASSLIGLGVTVLGNLLINALIPPPKPNTSSLEQENRYTISGWKNRFEPGAAVPLPLGRTRYAPPFGCYSYSEIVGDWQYVKAVFCPGYGPLNISEPRLGDTDLSEYDEVDIEIRQGLSGEQPLTLVTRQVIEENVGAELLRPYPRDDLGNIISGSTPKEEPVVRTTGADAWGASVILAWPGGLVAFSDDGNPRSHTVSIRIEQRLVQQDIWSLVTTLNVSASKLEAFFRQHTWRFPSRGRWQVRCVMQTAENTSSRIQQRVSWASIQTIRPEYPFNSPHPIALIAMRIKATHQLNGQLDNLNVLVQRPCLDYDRYSRQWVTRQTSNPASLYRYVLQSPANPKRAADDGIDLAALADWHVFCQDNNLKYDRVIDERETQLGDLLREIAAAGRATRRHDGLKWSVTIDRPNKPIWDHFSPRNSYDFRVTRSYVEPPDAFRVPFLDATNDYKPAERIVPWPGKEGAELLLTEELQMPGKTDPLEIYREARRRMYEAIHRPDVYTLSRDGGVQVAVRGDRIRMSSDVLSRVQSAARVIAIAGNIMELDELVAMEAGKAYAIRFRDGVSEADPLGTSVVRNVVTKAGETRFLQIAGDGPLPSGRGVRENGEPYDGDLIHFGEAASIDYDLIVTGVEAGDEFSSHYRFVDTSPIIDAAIAAETVPAWSGRAGADIGEGAFVPSAPRFTSIKSGITGTGVAGRIDYQIRPGVGSTAVAAYEIDHRLSGAAAWTTITIPVADGGGSITGYATGNTVELRARAQADDGTESLNSTIVTLVVGEADAGVPKALPSSNGEIVIGGLMGGAVIQFVTGADINTASVQVYRSLWNDFGSAVPVGSPVAVQPSRSYSLPIGDSTRQTLLLNGNFAASQGWNFSGWTINNGVANRSAAASTPLWQSVAIENGEAIRYGFRIASRSAGSVRARIGTSGDAPADDGSDQSAVGSYMGIVTATAARDSFAIRPTDQFAGSVDDVYAYRQTATCLSQGTHYVWLEPLNNDGVAGPRSGPLSVAVK